jgi:hypothetical protein
MQADMILPCRSRALCNCVHRLRLILLFALIFQAQAADMIGQTEPGSTSDQGNVDWFPPVPLQITAGVDIGYDDRVIGSDSGTSSSGQSSSFVRENVILSYDRGGEQTQIRLIGIGRFAQFLDLGTDDKDGNATLSLTHNFTRRLSLYASGYAAYQTEPDFAFNVGPENVRADHFFTNDIFSLTYYWLPRLAFVTSYNFRRVKYAEAPSTEASQDRMQHTVGEQLQFSLTSRTTLIGNYRFEITDYDTAPRDSITHYAIAGIDHHLTEHLVVHLLGGESFRSFKDDGDKIDPYAEGSVVYQSSNHSLIWTASYRVEEPSAELALTRTTIRTGLRLTYDLTSRLSSTTGVYYHHDENEGATTSMGSQDALRFTLGFKYTINKHFAAHLNYEHDTVSSLGAQSGYSRNRCFGGVTYTY